MRSAPIRLLTSNRNKIAEFNRFGLDVQAVTGIDIKEVMADSETVITYKAISSGPGNMVEDTILLIDGKEEVDIRYQLDNLSAVIGLPATWQVSLGVIIGDELILAFGSCHGAIVAPSSPGASDVFGFDDHFCPINNNPEKLTLYQLEQRGLKDFYSARRMAIEAFIHHGPGLKIRPVSSIPPWSGAYQG